MFAALLFEVEELIETEQRRRRRETVEEDFQLGGGRNNLEEESRELTRLKEQVESKVRRRIFWYFWTSLNFWGEGEAGVSKLREQMADQRKMNSRVGK